MPKETRNRRVRSGITLVESLLVMAILAVLVGLMLPAVQKLRESSARSHCTNNLRQLGQASHQYLITHGSFPPAAVSTSSTRLGGTRSVFLFLLPGLELSNVGRQHNATLDWEMQPSVYQTEMRVLTCPSAPNNHRDGGFEHNCTSITNGYTSDYTVPIAVRTSPFITLPLLNPKGLLQPDQVTRVSECSDGLSNTLLFVEDAGRPEHWLTNRFRQSGSRTPGGIWVDPKGAIHLDGFSADGLAQHGPCAVNCTNQNEIYAFHGKGANILLGDGTVRFLVKSVEINLVAALVTRANGESVSVNDL